MNRGNLFIFIVTHVKQLGGNGRGVVIVRSTPLEQVINEFDQFLQSDTINNMEIFKYTKQTDPKFPEMVIYKAGTGEEHIVFGRSEQGWKDDYGLTHTDVVVSIH
jgi:hypothetical protein